VFESFNPFNAQGGSTTFAPHCTTAEVKFTNVKGLMCRYLCVRGRFSAARCQRRGLGALRFTLATKDGTRGVESDAFQIYWAVRPLSADARRLKANVIRELAGDEE